MKNHYTKNLSEPWFSYILEGKKTVEGRLYKDDWRNLKEGDIITFYNEQKEGKDRREFKVEITELNVYSSFSYFFREEGIENCLPSYTLKEGLKVYYQYYTHDEERKFGVLSIKFRII